MPESKDEPKVAPKVVPKKEPEPDRSALHDELEELKARGNPDPARLAEIKQALAS